MIQGVIGKRARYVVFAVAIMLMVFYGYGSTKTTVGDAQEGSPYFFEDSEYNKDEYVLNHEFLGTNPIYILFETKERFGLHSVKIAKYLDAFSKRLRALEEVRYVTSYVDIVKGMNFFMFKMDLAKFCVPATDKEIGMYMTNFIYAVEPEVTRPYFDMPQQWANIQVIIKDHQTATIDKVMNFIKHDVETKGKPQVGDICKIHIAAGIIAKFASIIEEIRARHLVTLGLIALADVIICTVAFQSFSLALLVLFPLAIGVLVTYGIMGYFDIGLFLYTAPIASLGMGLGVDYSIYVVSRWSAEMKKTGDRRKALEAMSYGSGKAVLFTALAVAIGAFALMFSELRFQVIMGGFLGAVILVDMIGALFVLPAVFGVFKVKRFAQR